MRMQAVCVITGYRCTTHTCILSCAQRNICIAVLQLMVCICITCEICITEVHVLIHQQLMLTEVFAGPFNYSTAYACM